jgi:outer membrane biosynthesis protein TonB
MRSLIAVSLLVVIRIVAAPAAGDCDFTRYHPLHASDRTVLRRAEPVYPPEAERTRIQAMVAVRVLINAEGKVIQACATGPRILRAAAEQAALGWLFGKSELNGKPICTEDRLEFKFVLPRRKPPNAR